MLNYINPKPRKPSTIKLQTAYFSMSNVHEGFYDYDSNTIIKESYCRCSLQKKIKIYQNKKVIENGSHGKNNPSQSMGTEGR